MHVDTVYLVLWISLLHWLFNGFNKSFDRLLQVRLLITTNWYINFKLCYLVPYVMHFVEEPILLSWKVIPEIDIITFWWWWLWNFTKNKKISMVRRRWLDSAIIYLWFCGRILQQISTYCYFMRFTAMKKSL